jgi:hypothetical protein
VLSLIRAVEAYLQRLLQTLEALGHRWERDAEATVLALVPGGADPEPSAAPGEHVEGGNDLGEQTRVPVGEDIISIWNQ